MNVDLFSLSDACPVDPRDFPTTRYQGLKRKLAGPLFEAFSNIDSRNALDLYCGTATVSLLLRCMGKTVHANDLLCFNENSAFLFLHATKEFLGSAKHERVLRELLCSRPLKSRPVVSELYRGVFFKD